MWKDVQHHYPLEKCKLKLQLDTTTDQSDNTKSWQRGKATGALKQYVYKMTNFTTTLETVGPCLTKLNICLPHNPIILHVGIYPSKIKTCSHKTLYANI